MLFHTAVGVTLRAVFVIIICLNLTDSSPVSHYWTNFTEHVVVAGSIVDCHFRGNNSCGMVQLSSSLSVSAGWAFKVGKNSLFRSNISQFWLNAAKIRKRYFDNKLVFMHHYKRWIRTVSSGLQEWLLLSLFVTQCFLDCRGWKWPVARNIFDLNSVSDCALVCNTALLANYFAISTCILCVLAQYWLTWLLCNIFVVRTAVFTAFVRNWRCCYSTFIVAC